MSRSIAHLLLLSKLKTLQQAAKEAIAVGLVEPADQGRKALVFPESVQIWILSQLLVILIAGLKAACTRSHAAQSK
jgi:hypothetical protein